jgi:hypothetical protein
MVIDKQLTSRLTELANVCPQKPAAMKKLQRRWPELAIEVGSLPPIYDDTMEALRKYAEFPDVILQVGSLHGFVQRLWIGVPEATATLEQILMPEGERRVGINWKAHSLAYHPQTTIQRALYYLVQNSDRAKVCANMECVRPYFIGVRPNERYCSVACFDNAQRLAKAKWWRESGKAWLKNRKSQSRRAK